MSLTSDLLRGYTDTIILSCLAGSDSYGYEINKNITQKSEGELTLKEATLYTAFKRLEEAGYIRSYWGDEQSGARRRYYSVTDAGIGELSRLKTEWKNTRWLINKLILPEEKDNA